MRETCELTFSTAPGGRRLVRVPDPLANITPAMLNLAANRILAANPFDTMVGDLLALKSAVRVNVSRTVII